MSGPTAVVLDAVDASLRGSPEQSLFVREAVAVICEDTGVDQVEEVRRTALALWASLGDDEKKFWTSKIASSPAANTRSNPNNTLWRIQETSDSADVPTSSKHCSRNAWDTGVSNSMGKESPPSGFAGHKDDPAWINPDWNSMSKKKRQKLRVKIKKENADVDVMPFIGTDGKPLFVHHALRVVCQWQGNRFPDGETSRVVEELWALLSDELKERFKSDSGKMAGHPMIKPYMLLDTSRTTHQSREYFFHILDVMARFTGGDMRGLQADYNEQLNTDIKRKAASKEWKHLCK